VSRPSGSNPRGKSITFHTLNLSSQKIIEKDGTGFSLKLFAGEG
jgi:hypothetical protein